jgi:hypothetical protein
MYVFAIDGLLCIVSYVNRYNTVQASIGEDIHDRCSVHVSFPIRHPDPKPNQNPNPNPNPNVCVTLPFSPHLRPIYT